MSERGVALILVLLVMMMLSALAMSLAVMVSTESRVAATYRDGIETLYGAEDALERVLPDLSLSAAQGFDSVLAGLSASSFVDGPPGPRHLPDGTFTDLHALTSMLNCGQAACSDMDLDAEREERPWGRNNPRWQLYGHGAVASPGDGPLYAVVWVADDPSETDGDPSTDGGGTDNPGVGRLSIVVHAYGRARSRRVIELTVAAAEGRVHIVSWREVR